MSEKNDCQGSGIDLEGHGSDARVKDLLTDSNAWLRWIDSI